MRTLIFSTSDEAESLRDLHGGQIFKNLHHVGNVLALQSYLQSDTYAVAILVGDPLTFGFGIDVPTNVLFSDNYVKDERVREQARSRVRASTPAFKNLRFAVFESEEAYQRAKETGQAKEIDKLQAQVIVVGDKVTKCRPDDAVISFAKLAPLLKDYLPPFESVEKSAGDFETTASQFASRMDALDKDPDCNYYFGGMDKSKKICYYLGEFNSGRTERYLFMQEHGVVQTGKIPYLIKHQIVIQLTDADLKLSEISRLLDIDSEVVFDIVKDR